MQLAPGLPALGLGGARRPRDAVTLQAIAAVGQSRLMQVYGDELADHGLLAGQVLIAPLDFMERRQYLQARGTLARLLELGVVPVVNENDAIADDEIRFGDNDRLAALGGAPGRRRRARAADRHGGRCSPRILGSTRAHR